VPVSDERFSIVSDVVVVPRCVVVLFSWVSGQLVTWFFSTGVISPECFNGFVPFDVNGKAGAMALKL